MPNAGGKAWGGFAVAFADGSRVDFAFARGGYAAGRSVAGLFCIILVIADSHACRSFSVGRFGVDLRVSGCSYNSYYVNIAWGPDLVFCWFL